MNPPGTILVVDDDDDVRAALAEVLAEEGYRVTGATNGREALDCMRKGPRPDVILLDMMMPVMDGWQFRAEQQRDPRLAAIPVVVLSASPQYATETLDCACSLRKPVELDLLLETVARLCRCGAA